MKKIIGVLFIGFLLNACDDGDLNIETLDFESSTTYSCNASNPGFFIYKFKNNETLILQLDEVNFINEITPVGSPRTIYINATNKVIYRLYNGALSQTTICNSITPANPIVTNEWNATSGIIEIITTANRTTNETLNSSVVTGYTHSIKLKNINFLKSSGTNQLFSELSFGNYITPAIQPVDFTPFTLKNCGNYNLLFKVSGKQSLTFNLDSNLYINVITPVGTPRIGLLNSQDNVKFKIYNANINDAFVCADPTPSLPILEQVWTSENGVQNVSGIIEITTTIEHEIPTDNQSPIIGYRHKTILKKVTLTRNNVSFKLGDIYILGEFVRPL